MEAPLNVREEAWYARYYQTVEFHINNLHRKYPNATIYLMGIEGDVLYGKRTLQEWTFLQEDIDKHILDGKISKRPSNMRVSFESFPQVVEMFASQPDTYVLVASCPARIGDNHRVMEDVQDITSGKPWSAKVDLVLTADDRDDERHEIPEARGEEEVCRRAHEERKSRCRACRWRRGSRRP